jgi:hypothetical protein
MLCNIFFLGKVRFEERNVLKEIDFGVEVRILPFSCFESPFLLFNPGIEKGFLQHIY